MGAHSFLHLNTTFCSRKLPSTCQQSEMPAFHSDLPSSGTTISKIAVLPLRQASKASLRGPAPVTEDEDIVDQTIKLFKANILFTSFDMETDVDRVLVYLTFYIVECLRKLQKEPSLERGTAAMHSLARESFALPGDAGFPKSLNAFCSKPSRSEAEEMKKYFTQLRHETGYRLAEKVFDPALSTEGGPSKWWTCWAKKKFLNDALTSSR